MRYEKGHKDATRARILDVASRQFRENGVAAVGLAGIMAEAGLTNGAFYAHFKSKEDLLRAVLADALGRRETTLRSVSERGAGLEATIRDYLSPRHRDDPSHGCPMAAMVAEVARHSGKTRDAFTVRVGQFVALIATQIRRGTAAAAVGLLAAAVAICAVFCTFCIVAGFSRFGMLTSGFVAGPPK